MYKHLTSMLWAMLLLSGLNAQQTREPLHSVHHEETVIDKCHTEAVDQMLRNRFPEMGTREDFENWLAPKVRAYKEAAAEGRNARAVLTVPVVFHIIHNGTAVGSGPNISATYVNAQITQLNNDFRKIMGTSGHNTNPVGADTELQFCAAVVDPMGGAMAEPGINRINRNDKGWDAAPYYEGYIDGTIKPQSIWDPTKYVNVWVLALDPGLLGYAQYPSMSGLPGLGISGGPANTDGVVIQYYSVGSSTTPFPGAAPYDQGRTLTHELGHFFGLFHTFQGGCSVNNDYCEDTPRTSASSFGCPVGRTSCSGMLTMIENYMDYTDDGCMNIFTLDQKARIQAVMANSPRRMELPGSTVCNLPLSCSTCPIVAASSIISGTCDDHDTCFPVDDTYPTTLTVTHQTCAEETGDGKFTVVYDPSGFNIVFGPFDYASGTTTIVQMYIPAGAENGDIIRIVDNDYPCSLEYGNTFVPSPLTGCSNYSQPTIICPATWNACPGTTIAPATTGTATARDCDDNPLSVTYSDTEIGVGLSPGESVIRRTWTTAPDGMGNTATCDQIINRNDVTQPTVTTGTIASCYPTVAAAEAAALAATSATDNCATTLTETASTTGTCSAVVTVTTSDGYGNSRNVTYNTRIDNTPPVVTTGSIANCYQTVAAAEAAALAATTATDNCPGTLTETASTVGTCSAVITVTTSDQCGNSTPVTYNTRIDNTPPTLVCRNNTVFVTAGGIYTFQTADVVNTASSSDNCGSYTVAINPPSVNCTQAGTVVPVMVTATDPCGNSSSCVANITVQKGTGLPPPYVNSEVGTSGQIPGTATYDACERIFTVTSSGFSTSAGDDVHSAHQSLCGNSSLTAHVLSVQNGWGGIMMRESLAPGSKKVALKVDFAPGGSNSLIREVRSATNGIEQQQNFPIPPGETWLRLTRTGNVFQGLTSQDGINWSVRFSVTISMTNCLLTGLFAEAYNVNTVATATFGSVTSTGAGPVIPLLDGSQTAVADHGLKPEQVHLFPNPTNGVVTAAWDGLEGQDLNIQVFNTLGQPVWMRKIEKVEENTQTIDLSDQLSGIYWVRIQVADGATVTRRLLLVR